MSVPAFQDMMLPVVVFLRDGNERTSSEIRDMVASVMGLSDEDRKELLHSGNTRLGNRVNWACIHLKKAGLLESKSRGHFNITRRGLDVIGQSPDRIDIAFLKQFEEFRKFRFPSDSDKSLRNRDVIPSKESDEVEDHTPDEIIEEQSATLRSNLADEVLSKVKSCSPRFFEQLVVDLIVKMGYGGSIKEAGKATQYSNDEGIDGIIKEDRLGLDVIYLQAKRWEKAVSRPELQGFAGALQGQRAKKGIFITTSSFTSGAVDFCRNLESRIILIDGDELAGLMIDFNVGVSVQRTLEIKRIDSDYFSEEEI
ncbi:MAG: restriction endonuclease [Opitutales bacterium]|jgi:restriction system protein